MRGRGRIRRRSHAQHIAQVDQTEQSMATQFTGLVGGTLKVAEGVAATHKVTMAMVCLGPGLVSLALLQAPAPAFRAYLGALTCRAHLDEREWHGEVGCCSRPYIVAAASSRIIVFFCQLRSPAQLLRPLSKIISVELLNYRIFYD